MKVGRVGTLLILLAAIKACLGDTSLRRRRRQLFREDIPHYRKLDGAYNQRPQGENNIQNSINQGNQVDDIDNGGDVFSGPVRFQQQDAIIPVSARIPQHPPPHHHPPAPPHPPPHPPPHIHQNNFRGLSHNHINHNFEAFSPALLQFHGSPTTKTVIKDPPRSGHRQGGAFQNQLTALWHKNYHRNVPSRDNRHKHPVFSYSYREDH